MNRNNSKIRSILLALDQHTWTTGALETAAELAGRLGAELTVLFVEDVDLIRLAGLPFASEVGCTSCALRPLRLDDLEAQMRALARDMKKALTATANRFGTVWDFRVTRGRVSTEILAAAADADLVILGKRGWNLSRRLGSTVQMVISQRTGMTLVLHPGAKLNIPVVAIYNESGAASEALEIAAALAGIKNGKVMVLVVAQEGETALDLQDRAIGYLKGSGIEGGVKIMIKPTLDTIAHAVRDLGPVVLPCRHDFLRHEDLCNLVNLTENPVLLVR